jgi:hypothetical protein
MSAVGVNSAKVAPVAMDLTKDFDAFTLTRGVENSFRVDKKLVPGIDFEAGDWGVLNADNEIEKPGATPVRQTFLIITGTNRYDVKATGQVTIIMNTVFCKTNRFDKAQVYAVGDLLTVKDLGGGEAWVTRAAAGEPALAMVTEVGATTIEFKVLENGGVA